MRKLITLVIVLICLQLWAQVPDTTSVAPGRLIIKVNQAFQTIGTRTEIIKNLTIEIVSNEHTESPGHPRLFY